MSYIQEVMSLPVLAVRNTVLMPGETMPLVVGRENSVAMLKELQKNDENIIAVVSQRDEYTDDPGPDDLYEMGTLAAVLKIESLGDDTYTVLIQGRQRVSVTEWFQFKPFIIAQVETIEDDYAGDDMEVELLLEQLKRDAKEYITQSPMLDDDMARLVDAIDDPGNMADLATSQFRGNFAKKQDILETLDITRRLRKVIALIQGERELLKVVKQIQGEVKSSMDKHQREFFLREQLKAIQNELGEGEVDEIEDLKKRLAESGMKEEVMTHAEKELTRLARMHPSSPEYHVARTYLDALLEMPWDKGTDDNLDIDKARDVLDEDHYGLEKVKKRILEYLAVRKLKSDIKGPILALTGPPGVGKTSLGKSIARALGRKFIRVSLGGVRDEAEVRGHRRTYIGAMPGRIIQGIRRAGVNNPVFMLDEIDKLGNDFRGDPSFALLEALDPEQNNQFSDHYLEVPFDLSQVMFICTANVVSSIPGPLLDRMEVIEIPGYTREEKYHIGADYLVKEQVAENGLTPKDITFNKPGIEYIIDHYTREAGVRGLKREIASVARHVAVDVASGKTKKKTMIGPKKVKEALGVQRFELDNAEAKDRSGVSTGLAWTPTGGDIIFIETAKMAGKGEMKLTGQLGDVMKESALAAMSYIRSHPQIIGNRDEDFSNRDVHIHVPAGAIPKDGPSAGVAIFASLASLFSGEKVLHDVAMTGEITLRGKVLPVGGIKEKLLAAHRAGVKKVILPRRNRRDVEDIPEDIRKDLELVFVKEISEIMKHVIAGKH